MNQGLSVSNEDLLGFFQAATSLKRLHCEKGGLEQHRKHAEDRMKEYAAEIIRRMKK
jgi:hypothetical protein